MFLVKFTDPEWKTAALEGTSIRVGSVLHYRTIEDRKFRDEDEGEGPIVYKSKTPLDAATHNRIFHGEGVRLNDGWTIDTGGVPLISQPSVFNPFVFSCSLVRRNADIPKQAKQFQKKAWYFVSDVWRFADGIAHELRAHILGLASSMTMPDSARSKLDSLELRPVLGKVSYTNMSKERIVDETNAASFDPYNVQLRPYFQKPKGYESESEFRIIWVPNLGSAERNEFDLTSISIQTVDLSISNVGLSSKPRSIKVILDRRGRKIA